MVGMKEQIKNGTMTPDEALEIVKNSGEITSEHFVRWARKKKANPGKLISDQTEKSTKKKKKKHEPKSA